MQRLVLGRVDNEYTVIWLHTTDCTCFTISLQMNCVLGKHDLFKKTDWTNQQSLCIFRLAVLNLLADIPNRIEHILQGYLGGGGGGKAQSDWQYGHMGLVVCH